MNLARDIDWPAAVRALGAAMPPARWPERLREWLAAEAGDGAPWCVALSGGADSVAVLLALCQLRNAECGLRNDYGSEFDEGRDAAPPASGIAGDAGRSPLSCGGAVVRAKLADAGGAAFLPLDEMLREEVDDPEPVLKQRATVSPETRNAKRETRNPKLETRSAAPLLAFHFNHRLRGAAAEADAAYCRELCAALDVELVMGEASWPAGGEVSEAQARAARFSFFGDAMAKRGARALWLGHHRDDVVETLLLRLSRGSGSRGLAAPRPVQRMADRTVRLRPLLEVPKAEIVAALRTAGVPWCEDESNLGDAYFRNRLRHHVVPAWAAAAPADLGDAVGRSRALLEEEDEALELWTDRVLPAVLGEALPLAPLREAPVAVARRALHRWLLASELGEGLGRAAFNELLAAVRAAREVKLSAGEAGFLVVRSGELRLEAAETVMPDWAGRALDVPGQCEVPGGAFLRAVMVPLDAELRRRICAGEFDDGRTAFLGAMETCGSLSLRPWRPGDRYVPLGGALSSKLQDQFVNRRIPRQLRQRLPVVCAEDGSILWVPGLPPAQCVRITDGTMIALQLTYLPTNSLSASLHV